MISAAQLGDFKQALTFTLQKVNYLQDGLAYIEEARRPESKGVSVADLGVALDHARRVERHLFGVAGELKDFIDKLPEPAAFTAAGS